MAHRIQSPPEKAIKIQHDLGADIIMAFDECAPANSTKKYMEQALNRTHNWLSRCKKETRKIITKKNHTALALKPCLVLCKEEYSKTSALSQQNL